jgi:hypothetical protein
VPETFVIIGVLATPAVAAELALTLEEALERAERRDGWRFSPDALTFVADLAQTGRVHLEQVAARRKSAVVTPTVTPVTVPLSRSAKVDRMLTAAQVARAEGVKTSAIAARCRRGRVPGAEQTPLGRWHIPAAYVRRNT